jgi:acetate kinase
MTSMGRICQRDRVHHVLVLNAGSSSLKWLLLETPGETIHKRGDATWEGIEGTRHESEMIAALAELPPVDAVGHRVVHGGSRFREAVRIDESVRQSIAALGELAPLHNPAALAGIDAAARRFPDAAQVACFDTAFHATISEPAAVYPLPLEWRERWGLRRFGFHGLSVQYAVARAADVLGRLPARLVVCHLGGGCSVTAVLEGRSIDTSMGFTPLEGLMMARRAGSIDPGVLLYLLQHAGVSVRELERGLNEQSGLFGVSSGSADMRAVLAACNNGDQRARLALDVFVHRLVAAVGAMAATLGGLDALVFTGGIGEHSSLVRARVAAALRFLGVDLDPAANESPGGDIDLATSDSAVAVLVIAAREDLAIVRDVRRVLGWG